MVSDQAGPGSLRLLRIPVLWLQASHLESQGDTFIVKVIEAQLLFPKAHSKAVLWKPALHPSPAQRADVQETRRHPPVITLLFPPGSQKIRASSNISSHLPRAGHALKRVMECLCSEKASLIPTCPPFPLPKGTEVPSQDSRS